MARDSALLGSGEKRHACKLCGVVGHTQKCGRWHDSLIGTAAAETCQKKQQQECGVPKSKAGCALVARTRKLFGQHGCSGNHTTICVCSRNGIVVASMDSVVAECQLGCSGNHLLWQHGSYYLGQAGCQNTKPTRQTIFNHINFLQRRQHLETMNSQIHHFSQAKTPCREIPVCTKDNVFYMASFGR